MLPFDIKSLQMRTPPPEWVDERSNYLGATDIAAIVGVHPYRTQLGVYRDKMRLTPPSEPSAAVIHGQNLELYVAQCYSRATGAKLHKSRTYRDKNRPFLGANPDYEVRGERPLRLVECKTASFFAGKVFGSETDEVPDQYLVQCMWQLAMTKREVCDLAVLIGGQDFRIYRIKRDEELIETLIARAAEWWQTYIIAETPPPISGEKPDVEAVNGRYPTDCGATIYATPEAEALCVQLREIKRSIAQLETEEARLSNLIKEHMQDAAVMESSVGSVIWKTNAKGIRAFRWCEFEFNGEKE